MTRSTECKRKHSEVFFCLFVCFLDRKDYVILQKKTRVLFPKKNKYTLDGKTKNVLLKFPSVLSFIFSLTIISSLLHKSRKILFIVRFLFASSMPEKANHLLDSQFYLKCNFSAPRPSPCYHHKFKRHG